MGLKLRTLPRYERMRILRLLGVLSREATKMGTRSGETAWRLLAHRIPGSILSLMCWVAHELIPTTCILMHQVHLIDGFYLGHF